MRITGDGERPRVAVLVADEAPDTCEQWLRGAGADPMVLDADAAGLTLAGADGFVLSGSFLDVNPRLYGEAPSPQAQPSRLDTDRRDLALLRQALLDDVPIVGICRGAQLLNVALGGSLWQDVAGAPVPHFTIEAHRIRTGERSSLRQIIGRGAEVESAHHQAVRRLGRGVRPTAVSPDGLVESIDVPARRFALGVQWHPEAAASSTAGPLLGEALVAAAALRDRSPSG
jgi:gamma-glutamyl-gamma-aminobutyrate hydrolase PuuD